MRHVRLKGVCLAVIATILLHPLSSHARSLSSASGQDKDYMSLRSEALRELDAGNYPAAETHFIQAIEVLRARPRSADLAILLGELADLNRSLRRIPAAMKLYEESLSILKIIPKRETERALELREMGLLLHLQGKQRQAEQKYQESLVQAEKAGGKDSILLARTLDEVGQFYVEIGQPKKAEPLIRTSLQIRRTHFKSDDQRVAESLNSLGVAFEVQHKFDKAESLLRQSLVLAQSSLGADHPIIAIVLTNLGVVYKEIHRYDDAEQCLRRSLAIRLATLPRAHRDVAKTLFELGDVLIRRRNYAAAEPLVREALEIQRTVLPAYDYDNDLASMLQSYSQIMHELKNDDEARRFEAEAKRIRVYLSSTLRVP